MLSFMGISHHMDNTMCRARDIPIMPILMLISSPIPTGIAIWAAPITGRFMPKDTAQVMALTTAQVMVLDTAPPMAKDTAHPKSISLRI